MSQSESGQMSTIILMRIIKKWQKHLIICFFASIAAGFIISLPIFMTPMFKSSAVLYPSNLSPYSKETPTEQMVQLFNSEDVRDSLVKKLHLFKHYGIDSINGYPRYEMMKKLNENISNISKNNEINSNDLLCRLDSQRNIITEELNEVFEAKKAQLIQMYEDKIQSMLKQHQTDLINQESLYTNKLSIELETINKENDEPKTNN